MITNQYNNPTRLLFKFFLMAWYLQFIGSRSSAIDNHSMYSWNFKRFFRSVWTANNIFKKIYIKNSKTLGHVVDNDYLHIFIHLNFRLILLIFSSGFSFFFLLGKFSEISWKIILYFEIFNIYISYIDWIIVPWFTWWKCLPWQNTKN